MLSLKILPVEVVDRLNLSFGSRVIHKSHEGSCEIYLG